MSMSGWVVSSFETSKPKNLENDKNANEKSLAGRKRSRQQCDSFQKFGNTAQKSDFDQTWLEKYCPKNKDDLAVHKKKVAEVEDWLINSIRNNSPKQRILIVSGPTGCGKTVTVQTLAKHLKVGIQEWSNPISHRSQQPGSFQESQTQLFREFLTRADKYGNLGNEGAALPNKLILVEDFPNAFHMDAAELHEVLRSYKVVGHSPLVLVVTDCYERALLPKDFQQELGSTLISFNPVAPTNLLKALTRIAWKGSEVKPTKEVLQELSETANGDIRAAVNSLQFYCSGSCNRSNRGKQKQKVGERDSNLVIFRGLGKILYCKREGRVEKHHTLPDHLKKFERPRLVNDPEDIIRKTPMTPSSLSLFLHENYVPFFPGLEDLVRASDYFSVSDALDCEWASKDVLEEYVSYITTLGLMNSNGGSGVSSTCGTKGRWRPLHKPEYFKANKTVLQRTASARQLFVNCSWSSEEMFTVRLPYLQLCKPPWLLQGQKFFVQEMYSGTRSRIHRDAFDERDHFVPEVFHRDTMVHKRNDDDVIPVTVEDRNNPEMMIEEFSD